MEINQQNLIIKNFPSLLELTFCDELFLSRFENILSRGDLDAIETAGKNGGRIRKCKAFYDIILTRVGSFDVLLESLDYTRQTGVIKLLKDSHSQFACENTPCDNNDPKTKFFKFNRFLKPPDYIFEFLSDPTKTILIVTSTDFKITCERICETVTNCTYYNHNEFLKAIESPQSTTHALTKLPIVNCEHRVRDMIHLSQHVKGKFVIVGRHEGDSIYPEHSKTDDRILWNDLSPLFRSQIQKRIKSWFSLESSDYLTELENQSAELILQLIKNECPNLFKDTIPETIKYYIPRRLVTRNLISQNIFSHRGTDLFLIKGVERHELSELAKERTTASSSDVISGMHDHSTKFVLLEDDTHFDKIVICANKHPIHLLLHKDGNLFWLKSSGQIGILQDYIEDTKSQTVLNETEFRQKLSSSQADISAPVCISDTPGMGKSVLLAQIGAKLQQENDEGTVGFMIISELVRETKKFESSAGFHERIFDTVARHLCENLFGEAHLRRNKRELKHLLLDGFDEVNACDIQFGYRLVCQLRSIFSETKIWITTRPHMLLEIEKCLGVLGYNMKPFEEADQINFLELFWSREWRGDAKQNAGNKLQTIALECLKSVKSKVGTKREDDIAGIPLQCLLIGDVFEDAAVEYCISDGAILPVFKVNSIADLYEQLVEMKFCKFFKLHSNRGFNRKDLIQAHVYYSMSLLFPSHLKLLAKESQKLSLQDIFNVGIIESKCTPPVPRFIHRTLAEYFLAIYILDSISFSWNAKKSTLFFNQVLQSKRANIKIRNFVIAAEEFRHNVICYFIDQYLYKYGRIRLVNSSIQVSKLQKITYACAYGCFEKMFMTLFFPLTTESKHNEIYSEHFLRVCTVSAGKTMCSEVFYNFRKLRNRTSITDIKIHQYTLLHLAVIRGNYSLVEHLVKVEGFRENIVSEFNIFSTLIHECVSDSFSQDVRTIIGKKDIIKYLATISQNLVASPDLYENSPILSSRLHPILANELLTLTKHCSYVTQTLQFLHNCLKEYNSGQFATILVHILEIYEMGYFQAIWTTEFKDNLLIHKMFKLMEPDEKLLNLLKSSRVNFCVDEKRKSVIEIAVSNKRGKGCIIWLLRNIHFTNEQIYAVYIQAVKSLNIDAVAALLEEKKVDARLTVGRNYSNMLHIFFTLYVDKIHRKHIDLIQLLIDYGVSMNKKNVRGETAMYLFMNSALVFTEDWWELFEVLFSKTQTSPANDHLKKVEFMLNGIDYLGNGLGSLLNDCIREENINYVNFNGNSLLHLLWNFNGYTSTVDKILVEVWKMLVSNGADPMILNQKSETPIDTLMQRNMEANQTFEAVTYVLNKLSPCKISRINDIMVSIIKPNVRLKVITDVCVWYTENVRKSINSIRGTYKGKRVTMLDMALLSYNGDVLEYVLKTCECKEALQPFSNTWIHNCVEHMWSYERDLKFIKLVNDLYPILINTPNENGLVPLSMKLVNPKCVLDLVKLGANINAADEFGNTPLHWILKNNGFYSHVSEYFSIVKAIVVCGADVNAVTVNNESPLMISMDLDKYTFKSVFKLLLYNNADPAKLDSTGNTVLHNLPKREFGDPGDFQEIVEHLLEKGHLDLFFLPNNDGMTPIEIARQTYAEDSVIYKLIDNYEAQVHEEFQIE